MTSGTPDGAVPAPAPSAHLAAQLEPSESTWVRVIPLPVGGPQWLRAQWLRVLIQHRKAARGGVA